MGVFKATKNRKEEGAASSGGTFKATNQRSYNSAMVYEWERANKESASTLQSLTSKSQKNEYLSSDDLDTYSKALDNYIESSNSLRGITKSLGGALKDDDASWESTIASLKSSFDDTKEYWSRWKTEDAYKTAVTNYESKAKEIDALKNYDFDASKKEIDILERDLNSINYLEKQIAEINSENELLALAKAKGSKDAVVKMADNEKRIAILRSSLEDAYKQYNGKDALSSLISEKNALYNRAERYQRIGDLTSVSDVNSANYDQNFSAYATSNNAFADDMIYKYINDIEGQRQRTEDAYGSGVSTVPSEGGASMVLLPKPEALNRNLKYLSEDEIALYNYYYNKQGKDAADEYIDLLQEDLNYRAAEEMFKSVEGDTGLEMIFGVAAGLDQFNTGIESLVSNKDYIPVSATQAYSSMVREDLADAGFTLPDWLGGSSIGQVAYDAITTTSNMLPSIMISAIPGVGSVAGAITLGASSAGHAKAEMLNLGYTRSQANWYGAMVGASEAGLQYLLGGITKLGGKAPEGLTKLALEKVDNAIARVAITLGMGMASEGLEESLQTAIEPWLKSLATGVDFESASIDEVLYSGLLGAITSVLFEGASSVAEEVGTKELGSTFKESGAKNVTALANFGKQFADGTAANRLGNKVNENSSAYDIGRLLVESGSAVGEQNIADISSMLQRYGMSTVEANETAKWLIKAVDGGIFTKRQQKLLEDEPVVRVYKDLVGNTKNSVNQRNADYEALYELAREKSGATKTESEAAKASTQKAETTPTNENAPAKENATEGKFEASETGKTTHNGSEVKVESVASVKNGNVMLKLNDGNVVNANDVEFSTDEEARLYEAVRDEKMDADTANDFVSAYRAAANVLSSPQSVMDYRAGFVEAQTYGRLGIPFEAIARDGQYTSGLVGKQAQIAYNRGKVIGINNANAAQNAPKKTSAKKITYKEEIHVSNIKKSQAYKGLSETQKAGVDGMVAVYKSLGIDVYFFESPTNEKGKRIGKNGYFNPKDNSIHVDLYAGNDGRGLILFTAAHELTHYIKKNLPAKFKAFADMLFEKYEADGHSVAERLAAKRAKLAQNGRLRGLSEQQIIDLAYEEVVADACEAMLAKGDAFAELSAQVKAKDKGLWEAIKNFFANLVARIKNAYANLNPDSIEGNQIADMLETATELQKAWVEMLVEASDGNDIVEIDTSSESVAPIMNSERTWTESDYVIHRDQMAEKIATALGVSVKKATSYIDDINSIAKMIADDRVRLDYEASSFGSAFVSNVEYGGSFDYTTLCKKRRIYTGTFTEIQKRLKDVALTPDDILKIRNLMIEEGIEATCGLCYVEGSRANMGKFAKEFIRLYKRDNPDSWIPNMADVNTPDGVEQMRINHPEAYDQYVYFWNHYGKLQDSDKALFASQQKPKLYEARKEYKGEILEQFKGDTTVEKKNRNGGIRMQSFSDFEIVHLIDTMQVIMDMSTVGLAGQAYTKVPEFAEAFGNTGLKINLSLIAKGVDENGNLIFDDREGMPHETAFNLRDKYSKNVGTIIVTFTDEQLYAAMADPRIDFIIPFHRSQWKKGQYGAMGLPKGTKDYTYMQNEKLIKQTYHEYQGRMVKDKATNYMPNEYWDFSKSGKENAEAYLKMCAENNKRPKFYKLLDYDGNGTYSLKEDGSTDGYWKLLIDFKMYDNDGVGSRQMPVTPTFNMAEARKMLDEYKGGHSKYPVASSVVDTFVAEYNEENGTRYSDRDSDAMEFSDADLKYSIREESPPKKTMEGYKVFVVKNGKLYPPMVANPNAEDTPVGVWLNADVGTRAPDSKTGRMQVKAGGKGTQGGSGSLAFRPGWHLGETPLATQFDRLNPDTGVKELFPENFVWALCDIAADVDYQEEAMSYGYTKNGKFQHSLAGLPKLPTDGYYKYRTNPNPDTVPWLITGAMKVKKLLSDAEVNAILEEKGLPPKQRVGGDKTLADLGLSEYEGKVYSDRDTTAESASTRSILSNALESVAKEGEERNILRNYKTNVKLIEAEQAKLAKVKSDANALRFKKGRTAAETKQLEKLDAEAKAISTRINRYDSVLLKMEAMKPIKDIIAREKQKAYKRASEAGRKAMEKQKARTDESRSRQAIKADIQRSVKKMTKLFKSNKKDARSNVKDEMRGTIASTLALADLLFANEISNEDIVLAGVDNPSDKESIALNKYRELLEKRDSLVAEREAIHGNGNVTKEQGEKQDKRLAKIEEELKAIRSRLSALSGELSGVFERERRRINRSTVGAMINELSIGYKALEKSEFDYISNAYSTVLQSRLDVLATNLGGKTVRDMNHSELAELRDVLKMIEHMIRESNKLFVEGRKADLAETIGDMHNEVIGASFDRKELNPNADKVRNFVENFSWNNLRPVDAFARLGSQTFEQLFWDYIDGMGKAGVLVKEAGEVIANARKEYGYDKWDLSHVDKTYTTRDGYQFKPTLADKLSIYAYSQREQAMDHMVDGGFTFDTGADYTIEEKGKKKKLTRRKLSHTFRLTQEDIVKIISSLSNEQTAYVDAILPYLTSLGDKGNEVSLRLYGVKLFNEKVYFPLVSSKDYLNSTDQELGATKTMSSLVNWGAAKPTVPKANNPIVLRAFDDVVLEHIEQMSNYYGLTLPVENLRRVFDNVNRAEADAMPVSTKALIGDRFGIEAQKYFAQLITDLNGGVMSSGARGPLETLFSRAKGMMVSSNLSVVAQQYFAVARAMELIDPKYFTPFLHGEAKKTDMKQYDEMIKYAPIAIIKEMGGFDVGSRGRVKDYIGYEGVNKKSAEYVKKTIDDVASWGASQMDKLGWVTIWKAVKAEVASEQSLTPGTEEFYAACKKRFTEVITKTQVFDSVASRSGYMRSKRDFTKMATSFMGEPTVTVGRLYVALNNLARDIRNGNKDGIKSSAMHFVRTTLSVSAATVLSSLAKALVYAGRDDEEDEALLERWTRNFGEALADDIFILNSLPYARDIMSIINGFDVERPDTTLLSDIISSVKRMLDGEITAEDSLGLIGSVGNLLGVPLKNLIREIKAAINVIGDLTDNVNPTNMGGAFVSGFTGNERNKSERLYDAVVYGDKQKIAVLTKGMTESEITSAIRSALRENDPRIAEAAMASLENNEAKRKSLTMEIEREKNFSSTIVRGAINNEIQYIKNKVNEAKRAKGTDKYDDIVQKLLDKYPQRFVDKILK